MSEPHKKDEFGEYGYLPITMYSRPPFCAWDVPELGLKAGPIPVPSEPTTEEGESHHE